MKRSLAVASLAACVLTVSSAPARAHVSLVSGVGYANATQEVAFGVGHGCQGADTVKVRIEIPAGVTSVRPMRGDFANVSLEKDATGTVTAAVWQKADSDVLTADILYYKLVLRLKLPNTPFTTIFFPAHQTCRAADGTVSTVDWIALPGANAADAGADEPAPSLNILPARSPGWNKVTVPVAMPDLSTFFGDAAIVWKGTAAYSANPAVKQLIAGTPGVTALVGLDANDEIWVKY
jgi:uncharacterized protein YcnI